MKKQPEKIFYTSEDYDSDVNIILERLAKETNIHLVSLYRGSLPLGVRLSNITSAPLSVVQFQTRDGNDLEPKMVIDKEIKQDESIVILDDILDSGLTLQKTYEFLSKSYPKNKIIGFTLFLNLENNVHLDWCTSLNFSDGEWVVFEPWEEKK